MKIGIDIDDTTFITVKAMLKYADIYEAEILQKPINHKDFGLIKNRYYLKEFYGWNDETKFAFFNKYYKNVLEECTMMKDANTVINKLKKEGFEINFITARLTNIPNCDIKKITEDSLKKFNINYDSLNISISDKLEFFKNNNIDICIEDSYETCKELYNHGIKSILMTTKMNEKLDAGPIPRVNNWQEIYTLISKMNTND